MKRKHSKKIVFGILVALGILLANVFSTGWLIYHDGPYYGKVVDAESGAPVEGAAVLYAWSVRSKVGWGDIGGMPYCNAAEAITGREGNYKIPMIACWHLWPFMVLNEPRVQVFKPGYENKNVHWEEINPIRIRKVESEEERRKIIRTLSIRLSIPDDEVRRKAKQFLELANQESLRFGIEPETYDGGRK